MKFIHLLPLLLLLSLASAKKGVNVTGFNIQSYNQYLMFAHANITLSLLEIWDGAGNTDPIAWKLQYLLSHHGGIPDFDAIAVLNDTFSPEEICSGVAKALPPTVWPTYFNGSVWLDVRNRAGFCSRPLSGRVSYLENVIKACQNHGLSVGVASTVSDWIAVMGSQKAGSDVLKAVPLWYFNDNDKLNFDDFEYAGFGTWDAPKMKLYDSSFGIPSYHTYYV